MPGARALPNGGIHRGSISSTRTSPAPSGCSRRALISLSVNLAVMEETPEQTERKTGRVALHRARGLAVPRTAAHRTRVRTCQDRVALPQPGKGNVPGMVVRRMSPPTGGSPRMQNLGFPCGGLSWHECGGARRAGTRTCAVNANAALPPTVPTRRSLDAVGGRRRCRTASALWSARYDELAALGTERDTAGTAARGAGGVRRRHQRPRGRPADPARGDHRGGVARGGRADPGRRR